MCTLDLATFRRELGELLVYACQWVRAVIDSLLPLGRHLLELVDPRASRRSHRFPDHEELHGL
jgi:hypothetical protein